jgi:DNA-binding protein YbaB
MAKQSLSASSGKRPATKAAERGPERRKSQPDGRKGILVRATPEAWKELKRVAIDEERTLQDVMTEAINDVLKKYGKPPVA